MEIDSETLIAEVFRRPMLWDKTNGYYHNRVVVENNWKNIEAEMKQPKDQLKKKWKAIRDQFRIERKKIPIGISVDSGITEEQYNTYTTWPYFKSLLFLNNQMKSRKSASIEATQILNDDECFDDTVYPAAENVDGSHDSEEVTFAEMKKKKRTNLNGAAEILAIEKRKLELLEKKMNTKQERDDDEAFLDSLLPYMKNMDLNSKMLCRIEIQKVVYKYAFSVSENRHSLGQPEQANSNKGLTGNVNEYRIKRRRAENEDQHDTFTLPDDNNKICSFPSEIRIPNVAENISNIDQSSSYDNDAIWLRFEPILMDDDSTLKGVVGCRQCKSILKYDGTTKVQLDEHTCFSIAASTTAIAIENDLEFKDDPKTIATEVKEEIAEHYSM